MFTLQPGGHNLSLYLSEVTITGQTCSTVLVGDFGAAKSASLSVLLLGP